MDWVYFGGLAGTGFAGAFFGAMLGLGGGFLFVPLLTLVLNLPLHVAIATSLVGIVANSVTATSVYIKTGLTNIKLGLFLEVGAVTGGIIGAFAAALLAPSVLSALFAAFLIYVSYSMIKQPTLIKENVPLREKTQGPGSNQASARFSLATTYYDLSSGETVSYDVQRLPQGLGGSLAAGILSGLLGIGGGIVKVPIMNLIMEVPLKAAIATSCFMMSITAAASVFIHYYNGYIDPLVVAPVVLGAFFGAQAGAELSKRIESAVLGRIFSGVLFVVAIIMLLRGFNLSPF